MKIYCKRHQQGQIFNNKSLTESASTIVFKSSHEKNDFVDPAQEKQIKKIMSGKSLFGSDVPEVVIKSIFSKYDKDGSGRLEKTEVLAMMGDLGLDEKQAELCFMMLDKDGNNNVTEKELMDWLRAGEGYKVVDDPNRYSFLRRVADAFRRYDRDGSGVIDKDEFRALLASGGKDWRSCDDSVIEKALSIVDKDGSGTVSFTEFLDWMDKVNAKGKK